jgi:hypothetical protein
MGYRSDVAIGFLFKDAEAVTAFMTFIRLLGDKDMNEALKDYKVLPNHVVHAFFESVKWYDSYIDVISHHRMLDYANQQEIPNVFVRIGEETDDNEYKLNDFTDEHYVLSDHFGISRTVQRPSGGEYFIKREGEEA